MTVRCTYIFLHPTFKKKKPPRHFHPSPVLNVKVKYKPLDLNDDTKSDNYLG